MNKIDDLNYSTLKFDKILILTFESSDILSHSTTQ